MFNSLSLSRCINQSAENVIAEQTKQKEVDPYANLSKKEKKKKKKQVIVYYTILCNAFFLIFILFVKVKCCTVSENINNAFFLNIQVFLSVKKT